MIVSATSAAGALPSLLDIKGIAEYLCVSERHIRHLVAGRRIPYVKWGHLVRFDPVEVSQWITENKVTTATDTRRYW
jgi:excisionase family DNA binding protein